MDSLFSTFSADVSIGIGLQEQAEGSAEADLNEIEVVDEFKEEKDGQVIVRHACVMPKGHAYAPLSSSREKIRCEYPFALDRFQELSLQCLERDENVLVSAHTSAGKTLIAEYAISISLERKQRVIYTSPIKALSNQKYRELNEKFGDVGLMTGDVTLNPESTCVVMTTEILRNMIYKGTEILRETHFIVFDEVHYMRDRERGFVWEETIILLPSTTRFIFLSATIPNAIEFSSWVVSIHKEPCHVVYTEKRPTPLEHFIYVNPTMERGGREEREVKRVKDGGKTLYDQESTGLFLFVRKDGQLERGQFQKIKHRLHAERRQRRPVVRVEKVIRILKNTDNIPCIVFSFRRKECEEYGVKAASLFDLTTDEEKELVETIYGNALKSLREEDKTLPQITTILPILKQGIGIHHSGLLPIIKEVIEILFQENLLKVLFATETFSIGLNMPARTVVFTSITKFDGEQTRHVTSGEYIQMSGRAGRRGRDATGNVLLILSDGNTEEGALRSILAGESNRLDSAFKLTYNMILNLLRMDGMDEHIVLKKSFLQFQSGFRVPEIRKRIVEEGKAKAAVEQQIAQNMQGLGEEGRSAELLVSLRKERVQGVWDKSKLNARTYAKALERGKVVVFLKYSQGERGIDYSNEIFLELAVVWGCEERENKEEKKIEILTATGHQTIEMKNLHSITKLKVEMEGSERGRVSRREVPHARVVEKVKESLRLIEEKYSAGAEGDVLDRCNLPMLKEGILTAEAKTEKGPDEAKRREQKLLKDLTERMGAAGLKETLCLLSEREGMAKRIKELQQEEKSKAHIIKNEDYKSMKKVLEELEYIKGVEVLMKGKVASEISSGDEILLTEMVFNNDFAKLGAGRICSLLSCVVTEDKADDNMVLSEQSKEVFSIFSSTFKKVSETFRKVVVGFDERKYRERFSESLMDVVFLWTEGRSFREICSSTTVFEGSIIRVFRRLEEVLKEMVRAARVVGNLELENKFSSCITLIKRDIVFANSLYL